MADKKINDLPVQANPTGSMQLETDITGSIENKILLGDNPADNFNTTSKTIMGAVNELDTVKAGLADNNIFTGNNTFDTGLLSKGAITVQQGTDSIVLSNGDAIASGLIVGDTVKGRVELTSGGNAIDGSLSLVDSTDADVVTFDIGTSTYSFGNNKIQDVSDPVNPKDVVNLETLNLHPGTQQTQIQQFTVASTPLNTYTLPSNPPPDPNAPSFLAYNGIVYNALEGHYTISGTTLTWNEPTLDGGVGPILLETGESLLLVYNTAINGGGVISNVTEKGSGINVKHIGDNTWVSTSINGNMLTQIDESNPSEPVYNVRFGHNLAPDTVLTPSNTALASVYSRLGKLSPHHGSLSPIHTVTSGTYSPEADRNNWQILLIGPPGVASLNLNQDISISPGYYIYVSTIESYDVDLVIGTGITVRGRYTTGGAPSWGQPFVFTSAHEVLRFYPNLTIKFTYIGGHTWLAQNGVLRGI